MGICEDDLGMQAHLKEAIEDWAKAERITIDILCYQSAEAFITAWPDVVVDLVQDVVILVSDG